VWIGIGLELDELAWIVVVPPAVATASHARIASISLLFLLLLCWKRQ